MRYFSTGRTKKMDNDDDYDDYDDRYASGGAAQLRRY